MILNQLPPGIFLRLVASEGDDLRLQHQPEYFNCLVEVPLQKEIEKQLIIPDGCVEMFFILGDDVKRYISEHEFIIQPREMVLGQITETFHIKPTGYVNTFAIRFYPFGFANFVSTPIENLANKETPIKELFGAEDAKDLTKQIRTAANTEERISIIESFLIGRLNTTESINKIVQSTIDALISSGGANSIHSILKSNPSKRRQLERNFKRQIGMSPKQLGRVVRLQTALRMILNQNSESLTDIAYESEYYDQAHFIKDFREFTGTTPKDFLGDEKMELSSIFYKND